MSSPLITQLVNGQSVTAASEYTDEAASAYFKDRWQEIVNLFQQIPDGVTDPKLQAFGIAVQYYLLQQAADKGIDSATGDVAEDPPTGRVFKFTVEMVRSLDKLAVSLKAAHLLDPDVLNFTISPADALTRLNQWKDLATVNVSSILASMGSAITNNRTLQALIELEYVKLGNDLIGEQLDKLDQALTLTEQALDVLGQLQKLKNLLKPINQTEEEVRTQRIATGHLWTFLGELDYQSSASPSPFQDPGNSGPKEFQSAYDQILNGLFKKPIGVTVEVTADDVLAFQKGKTDLMAIRAQLLDIFEGVENPPPLLGKIDTLLAEMNPETVNLPATNYVEFSSTLKIDEFDPPPPDGVMIIPGGEVKEPWLRYTPSGGTNSPYDWYGPEVNFLLAGPGNAGGSFVKLIDMDDVDPDLRDALILSLQSDPNFHYVDQFDNKVVFYYLGYDPDNPDVPPPMDFTVGPLANNPFEDDILDLAVTWDGPDYRHFDGTGFVEEELKLFKRVPTTIGSPFVANKYVIVNPTPEAIAWVNARKFDDNPPTAKTIWPQDAGFVELTGLFRQSRDPDQLDEIGIELNGGQDDIHDIEWDNNFGALKTPGAKGTLPIPISSLVGQPNEFAVSMLQMMAWIEDNYPNQDVTDAGLFQKTLTEAITAAQNLNDTQKEDLRRFMYLFEQFYKSASAMLQAIDRMINKMAQNIRG